MSPSRAAKKEASQARRKVRRDQQGHFMARREELDKAKVRCLLVLIVSIVDASLRRWPTR
jgi:hypothetical protein